MKYLSQNSIRSLRFRRWSRAGYAVFRSLGCNVTIGNLLMNISEKALLKSGIDSTPFIFDNKEYILDDAEDELDSELCLLLQTNLNIQLSTEIAGNYFGTNPLYKNITVDTCYACINRFLFLITATFMRRKVAPINQNKK